MQKLTLVVTPQSGDTPSFRTTRTTEVILEVTNSAFGGGVIAMEYSLDDTTFVAFIDDGAAVTFTTNTHAAYRLPGGRFWRLSNDGTVANTTVYVDGEHIQL